MNSHVNSGDLSVKADIPSHKEVLATSKAGANALAENTMLSEALPEIYAASLTDFRKGNYEIVLADEADIVLQLWRYRPNILGESGIDPLSLAISLKDDKDERVQMAIDELLEGFQW